MKTIFTLTFLFITGVLMAQTSFKTAINISSQSEYNDIFEIVQLNDGSYVGVGTSDYVSGGKILLVKLNSQGSLVSSSIINTSTDDEGVSIIKTSDGGFAVSGSLGDSMAILRFNSNLTLQWQKQYAVSDAGSIGARLVQTSDGGFMIVGYVYDADDNSAGYLVKTDSQGNVSFSKQYGSFAENSLLDIVATNDGNYALLQTSGDIGDTLPDSSALIKIKPDGSVIWTSRINTGGYGQFPISLLQASDGGLVVSGIVEQPFTIFGQSTLTFEMMMAKWNSSGNLLWAKNISSASSNLTVSIGYGLAEDKDGGYIFGGEFDKTSDDFLTDTSSSYLIKLSSSGSLVWTKTISNTTDNNNLFYSVIKTSDGGFAVSGNGYQSNSDAFFYNGIIFKFNSSGEICGGTGSDGTIANLGTGGLSTNITTANLTTSAKSVAVTTTSVGAGADLCSSLPVQLLSFNATLQNKSVNIEWKTASEVNTDYFMVERSSRTNAFTDLQKVAAKGNSSLVQTYTTNDLQPLPGTSYYRLKEVDKDGSITYSGIVAVTVVANGTIVISPNPVRNNVNVVLQSNAGSQAVFQITDMTGKTVTTQSAKLSAGANTISIPAASLSKGMYMLKVIENNAVQSLRFIKE